MESETSTYTIKSEEVVVRLGDGTIDARNKDNKIVHSISTTEEDYLRKFVRHLIYNNFKLVDYFSRE